jgi:glutamate/tyrosine decarboxylase-like PLP-dependent enzyme
LWFHVDAAFGAIAMLSPALRPLFAGMARPDPAAFDFHKLAQIPYEAGRIAVRDAGAHRATSQGRPLTCGGRRAASGPVSRGRSISSCRAGSGR